MVERVALKILDVFAGGAKNAKCLKHGSQRFRAFYHISITTSSFPSDWLHFSFRMEVFWVFFCEHTGHFYLAADVTDNWISRAAAALLCAPLISMVSG